MKGRVLLFQGRHMLLEETCVLLWSGCACMCSVRRIWCSANPLCNGAANPLPLYPALSLSPFLHAEVYVKALRKTITLTCTHQIKASDADSESSACWCTPVCVCVCARQLISSLICSCLVVGCGHSSSLWAMFESMCACLFWCINLVHGFRLCWTMKFLYKPLKIGEQGR